MDGPTLDRFSQVVESIYDAALDPTRWPAAVAGVAALQQASKVNFLTPAVAPSAGGFIFPLGVSEQVIEIWDARFRGEEVEALRRDAHLRPHHQHPAGSIHRRGSTASATSACSHPTHLCALQSPPSRWQRRPRRPHPIRNPPPHRIRYKPLLA